MRIEKISLYDWRNIKQATLSISNQFGILYGNNGAGKTNILEALYMFATLRSFRENSPQNIIRRGFKSTRIEADVRSPYGLRKMEWSYGNRGRNLLIDGERVTKLSSWFTPLRVILFCPAHLQIVRGGPATRRQFVDRARFTSNPAYIELAREYGRILSHKKALLRSEKIDEMELDVWNEKLVNSGVRIALQRQMILKELELPFKEMHNFIAGSDNNEVDLKLSGISGKPSEMVREIFIDQLAKKKKEEILLKRCLTGPHLDDIKIKIDGVSAKKYASQGQIRTIVIALKFAELEAAHIRGESPLFLLDDLSSELDRDRTKKLLELLIERENQIWITTTDSRYLSALPHSSINQWFVEAGQITKR